MGIEIEFDPKKGRHENDTIEAVSIIKKFGKDELREGNRLYSIGMPKELIEKTIQSKFPNYSKEYVSELVRVILDKSLETAK